MGRAAEKTRPGRGPRNGPGYFYGFDQTVTYVLRSQVRTYTGVTERFQFAAGQAMGFPMRDDATDEQKIARGERLARMRANPAYRVYVYGEEPPPTQEPMWADQQASTNPEVDVDTGEATRAWAPVAETAPPVRMPVVGPTPAGQSSREVAAAADDGGDTGEQAPPAMTAEATPRVPAWDRTPGKD